MSNDLGPNDLPEEADVPVVTPEMIEIGVATFVKVAPLWEIDGDRLPAILSRVYCAMLKISRR